MAVMTIRPSSKTLKPFYTLAFLLAAVILFIANNRPAGGDSLYWLLVIPGAIFAYALVRHFLLFFTRLTITDKRLTYESGLLSRSTRTMDLAKIQDIQVEQSLLQRLLGLGTISIETAGERGPLVMEGIDDPHAVAEQILAAAGKTS